MFCAFHKERLAHAKCDGCDAQICSDCEHAFNGRVYCPNCFSNTGTIVDKKYLERSPILALLLSFFPGLGQVYNGQLLKGVLIFFSCWLIIPWFYGMYDAYTTACRINAREVETNISPALLAGCLALIVMLMGMFIGGPFFIFKAIPNVIQSVVFGASEAQVKRALEDISGAVQAYQQDHGKYPQDVTDLYFGDISYLSEMHCDTVKNNYRYDCKFNRMGYTVLVMPLKEGLPGYRMTPGPVVEKFQ